MRITKKFARSSAIGKQVFVPCDLSKTDPKVLKEVQVLTGNITKMEMKTKFVTILLG